jgi:hypothetical protein
MPLLLENSPPWRARRVKISEPTTRSRQARCDRRQAAGRCRARRHAAGPCSRGRRARCCPVRTAAASSTKAWPLLELRSCRRRICRRGSSGPADRRECQPAARRGRPPRARVGAVDVVLRLAVGEVQAHDIDAGADHAFQHLGVTTTPGRAWQRSWYLDTWVSYSCRTPSSGRWGRLATALISAKKRGVHGLLLRQCLSGFRIL